MIRYPIPPQRILAVDDEPLVRQTIQIVLRAEGHYVSAVGSGAEALEELARSPYDVVFTDHIMSGMTGAELASIIKARHPSQIVIMLSAYGNVIDQLTQETPRVDFVLTKPIDIPLLRLTLLRLTQPIVKPCSRV